MIQLKVKRLNNDAKLPVQATPGSGCWDVYASSEPVYRDGYLEYATGLAFELPEGYDMLVFPRSSISTTDLILTNGVGYLDNDYRGELRFRFRVFFEWQDTRVYKKGDRIGQIRLIERHDISILEVDELSETDRGTGGFGSTGS